MTDEQVPVAWSPSIKSILKSIKVVAEAGNLDPDRFRQQDFWPGAVFGKRGNVDFRDISQRWLRDITRNWCWDNLNRLESFDALSGGAREINYFSEYLRTNMIGAGEDLERLDRIVVQGFAAYIASLVATNAVRHLDRRTTKQQATWNKTTQWLSLLAVQRILRYGRETGQMDEIPGSFMLTDDLLVRRPRPNADDETGDAIPASQLRQLFSPSALAMLAALHPQMPNIVRIAAETGRRPIEVVTLPYDCIDETSAGGPYLVYTETKVTGGETRNLPVLAIVVETVRDAQTQARARYPRVPTDSLCLFPRTTMNAQGCHPTAPWTFSKYFGQWIDQLAQDNSSEVGHDKNTVPEDWSEISPYSFRHTYAQRHADAGTAPDVLMELMGHEKISTTMGYYRIPQKRRREAADIVGNIIIVGDHLVIRPMSGDHSLANERSTVAVPFGKCSNPQNVAAEGYGCPIRHRCFGCASFSSDPSYLPEMRRRLLDLKATRARVDAFSGASEWAKRDARPSDEEIAAIQARITAEEDKLARGTPEQRALIDDASQTLRKARAVAQAELILRRPNGDDALAPRHADPRHVVDSVGSVIDD